jgi:hypothetical protein
MSHRVFAGVMGALVSIAWFERAISDRTPQAGHGVVQGGSRGGGAVDMTDGTW